jgi:type IV secretory pathway VirD2 relaxase
MKVKLCRDAGKARAHVNYIAFRSRETPGEERGAFDQRSDHANVERFNENLEDRLTRHPMANKAYKLTLSLSEKEFRERGLTSWKPVVREAMANLQKQWGREFQWIASEHMAKGHPHVHIVIKATCVDESGRFRQLRLDKQHLLDVKREVNRVIERHRVRDQERFHSHSRGDTFLRAFETALRALTRHDREEEQELEMAHQRWLRGRSRDRDDDRGR